MRNELGKRYEIQSENWIAKGYDEVIMIQFLKFKMEMLKIEQNKLQSKNPTPSSKQNFRKRGHTACNFKLCDFEA